MSVKVIIIGLIGLYVLGGAIFNWEWFIGGRRASFFVQSLGRTGTRILYGLIGLGVLGLSVYMYVNP